jgi:hypothetical protein
MDNQLKHFSELANRSGAAEPGALTGGDSSDRHCGQLRERMPGLRQREPSNDPPALLRSAENLAAFLARLCGAAAMLGIAARERIVRLAVKDILIGDDTVTIRHSISAP